MIWLSEPTIECPVEIRTAYNTCRRYSRVDRYRSRTEVTDDTVMTAFAWQFLPQITGDTINEPELFAWSYTIKAVRRGIDVATAVQEAENTIARIKNQNAIRRILVFNTATAAAASEGIKNMLDASEDYTELDVRTMLTSTPNHRIHVYKYTQENYVIYVVLNNLDTPGVIYKLSAAIMYTENHFGDATTQWAEAWMSGNPDTIYTQAIAYYKEYNDKKQEREFTEALNAMVTNLSETKKKFFEKRIDELQCNIESYYNEITRLVKDMNQVKAAYLLQITTNEDQKIKDLQEYIRKCKDKIAYIKADSNLLYLVYRTPLMFFEEDLLKPYFQSTRSNVVTCAAAWKQQLLKDLFMNKKYTLQIESSIMLDLTNKSFRYVPINNLVTTDSMQGIPNPHHLYYNCWGDNQPIIHRALQEGDYLQAILTAFAAMAGLNLSDTAVLEKFVRDEFVSYNNIPCLTNNETGEVITIANYERRYNNAPNETNE